MVQDAEGRLRPSTSGEPFDADLSSALPVIAGPAIARPSSRPQTASSRSTGTVGSRASSDVYAAGDGTDVPGQAGRARDPAGRCRAEHIAAELGAELDPEPFEPVLRGQLITGAESLHMKHGLTGGQGEGQASLDYLWWPPQKVGGRYLAAWLGHTAPTDLEPPSGRSTSRSPGHTNGTASRSPTTPSRATRADRRGGRQRSTRLFSIA